MCSPCIMRRGNVGCPHEHDGYDPSYIREFHIMLVRDPCIRCKGSLGGMDGVYLAGCFPA